MAVLSVLDPLEHELRQPSTIKWNKMSAEKPITQKDMLFKIYRINYIQFEITKVRRLYEDSPYKYKEDFYQIYLPVTETEKIIEDRSKISVWHWVDIKSHDRIEWCELE